MDNLGRKIAACKTMREAVRVFRSMPDENVERINASKEKMIDIYKYFTSSFEDAKDVMQKYNCGQ